jgi:hypothetical protein
MSLKAKQINEQKTGRRRSCKPSIKERGKIAVTV